MQVVRLWWEESFANFAALSSALAFRPAILAHFSLALKRLMRD